MPSYTGDGSCCCGTPTGEVTTTCCAPTTIPRTLFATMSFDWIFGTDYPAVTATLVYDDGSQRWKGTASCNGVVFEVQIYCDGSPFPGQWFFDLIISGVSYGVPGAGTAGAANLLACDPFDLTGEISTDVNYSDFPFCGAVGDIMQEFFMTVTE